MAARLSDLILSAEAIERGFGGVGSKTPRTSRFLDNFGFGEVARVSLLLFLVYVDAVIWHNVFASPAARPTFDSTMAEVVGALFGLLLAVLVFSVQLHAARTDEGAFAVPFLVRTHRIFPIMSLMAGVTLGNVTAASTASLLPAWRLDAVAALNLVAVPMIVMASLWLIHVTIRDASRRSFDPSLPIFRRDMRHALAENLRRARMNEALPKECKPHGLEVGYLPHTSDVVRHEFVASAEGRLMDIDLRWLRELGARLRYLSADVTGYLQLGIGGMIGGEPVLVVGSKQPKAQVDEPDRLDGACPSEMGIDANRPDAVEAARADIQRILDHALCILPAEQGTGSAALREFLRRVGQYLRELAQDKRAGKLEESLRRLETIATEWAKLAPAAPLGARRPIFGSYDALDGPLAVELPDAMLAAIRTEDDQTLDPFISLLTRLTMFGVQNRLPVLLNEIGGLIQYAYYQSTEVAALSEYCKRRFDEVAHHLFLLFPSRSRQPRANGDETTDDDGSESACLDQALWIALNIIRAAIDRNRVDDAVRFVERLFEHERHSQPHEWWGTEAPTADSYETLYDYVRIVLAGWCVAWIERHKSGTEAAAAVLQLIPASQIPARRLMAVWELYRSGEVFRAPIDYRIGVEHWDPDDPREYRVGVGEARNVDGHWIDRGLHALLLHARDRSVRNADRYFEAPCARSVWNAESSRQWLERLAAMSPVHVAEGDREERVESVLVMIGWRQHRAELHYVERSIEEPIDDAVWKDLCESVESAWRQQRHWIDAVDSRCQRLEAAEVIPSRRVRGGLRTPRDYFVPGNNWAGGFAGFLAEQLAIREAIATFWLAETLCPAGESIEKLALIREFIDQAVTQLRAKDFEPNIVVLPQADRFACAVFDKPLWSLPERDRFGRAGVGEWKGLLVLRWPYVDAKSVLVADACQLFGSHPVKGRALSMELHDLTADEREQWLRRVRADVDAGQSPKTDELRVVAEGWLIPTLGLRKLAAGVTLGLSESDGSFVMSEFDRLYHRVGCSEVEHDDGVRLRLVPRLDNETEDREPCPVCKPETLDREARRRQ